MIDRRVHGSKTHAAPAAGGGGVWNGLCISNYMDAVLARLYTNRQTALIFSSLRVVILIRTCWVKGGEDLNINLGVHNRKHVEIYVVVRGSEFVRRFPDWVVFAEG